MAKHEVTVYVCDKCGTEDNDPTKFQHVTVNAIMPSKKGLKYQQVSSRDLCVESCLGAPGVNRDKA